jgi:hypothetical protein
MELSTTSMLLQRRREPRTMLDALDVSLEDTALLEEVHLTAELLIAASHSETHLGQAEIDRILGLDRPA